MNNINLTLDLLKNEAKIFANMESKTDDPCIYGITDGKAVGTYLEHKFQEYLKIKYNYTASKLNLGFFLNFIKAVCEAGVLALRKIRLCRVSENQTHFSITLIYLQK